MSEPYLYCTGYASLAHSLTSSSDRVPPRSVLLFNTVRDTCRWINAPSSLAELNGAESIQIGPHNLKCFVQVPILTFIVSKAARRHQTERTLRYLICAIGHNLVLQRVDGPENVVFMFFLSAIFVFTIPRRGFVVEFATPSAVDNVLCL